MYQCLLRWGWFVPQTQTSETELSSLSRRSLQECTTLIQTRAVLLTLCWYTAAFPPSLSRPASTLGIHRYFKRQRKTLRRNIASLKFVCRRTEANSGSAVTAVSQQHQMLLLSVKNRRNTSETESRSAEVWRDAQESIIIGPWPDVNLSFLRLYTILLFITDTWLWICCCTLEKQYLYSWMCSSVTNQTCFFSTAAN